MKWHVDNLLVDPDPGPGVSQPTTLGELIRERRLAHGMSLSQFASNVGVETAVARTWERGEATPETERRSAVAAVLQLEPDVLDAAWPPADAEPMAEEVVEASPEDNGSAPDPDTHLIAGGVVAAGAETSAPAISDTSELPAAVLTEEPTQAVGAPVVLADPADTETL